MSKQSLVPSTVSRRIELAREMMQRAGVNALLIPSADPHLSEYLPEHWQGRRWLSGFQGSVGTLVVTAQFAGLWADSRYWEQAAVELDGSGVVLIKFEPGQLSPAQWLVEQVPAGGVVSVDGSVMALASGRDLHAKLEARGVILQTHTDLLNDIWTDRPGLPRFPVYEHAFPYATVSRSSKLAALRETMRHRDVHAHVIAALDDIAWLFNLRGSDVAYNPLFLAYALVEPQRALLFVDKSKVDEPLRRSLEGDGVELCDYGEVAKVLQALCPGTRLLVDPARVTLGLIANLQPTVELVEAINPTQLSKSQKADGDLAHIRQAMEQDGAALCEFFAWLESNLGFGEITELTIDEQLTAARARRKGFISPSFATIAAFNANGAMPHYRATTQSHARIEGSGLLLIDSGGQYLGGTTDITRMIPIGEPSTEQRHDCTRVLKGVIALSRARFPEGTSAPMLDAIARAPIWADQVDYGHGTGHGVGYFLNVHEGPQVIAFRSTASAHTAMHARMITSIEPGTYRPGRWGVRIENLVVTRDVGSSEFGRFLDFETLTLCPIDTRCLLIEMLDADERAWLNAYHGQVFQRLAPLLERDALIWLERRTQSI
ncbi:aminopeptidase P family protein [Pseudomonas sp.]|uniref:aminopeptidase P family protein n=1 Tax=Pseudomonas sp. TaxID=306 RepID=UPI0028B0EC65|nr:aminopeptidase P family protein [Pseudomonas sp.]